MTGVVVVKKNSVLVVKRGNQVLVIKETVSRVISAGVRLMQNIYQGGGADKHYAHSQLIPSDTWLVAHNLGKHPSATVVDSAGSVVIGDVSYIDSNNLQLNFSGAFAGTAYLN
ncbi:MAG: hypothetical protein WC073_10855 [Sterolibacterium sp.]